MSLFTCTSELVGGKVASYNGAQTWMNQFYFIYFNSVESSSTVQNYSICMPYCRAICAVITWATTFLHFCGLRYWIWFLWTMLMNSSSVTDCADGLLYLWTVLKSHKIHIYCHSAVMNIPTTKVPYFIMYRLADLTVLMFKAWWSTVLYPWNSYSNCSTFKCVPRSRIAWIDVETSELPVTSESITTVC